jgi:hypothetical protein
MIWVLTVHHEAELANCERTRKRSRADGKIDGLILTEAVALRCLPLQ